MIKTQLARLISAGAAGLSLAACASLPDRAGPEPELVLSGWGGPDIPLFLAQPATISADTPVVFVMHGTLRNASTYRDAWVEIAEACQMIAVAPEFSRENYPGAAGYNLGNLGGEGPSSYAAIQPAFETVREAFGLDASDYGVFGHSAGAQFVHRLVMFEPDSDAGLVVAANAGWYTLPIAEEAWPYGLDGAPAAALTPDEIVTRQMVLLLGEEDNDPQAEHLRTTPEAMRQGAHRFERGHFIMSTVQSLADEAGLATRWRIETVPGVGHNNARMAGPALEHLLDADRLTRPACARLARGD